MTSQKSNNTLSLILGFALLAFILFFVGKLLFSLVSNLDKLNANILVSVLAGSFTITGFFVTRYLEKKKVTEQHIRQQKLPIYEEFLGFVFKVFQDTKKEDSDVSEAEMQAFFWTLNQKSILWLSDRTLKSYANWRSDMATISAGDDDQHTKTLKLLLAFEKLLLDFRKDIGHKNSNIERGDIISLFVNDWKEFSIKSESTAG